MEQITLHSPFYGNENRFTFMFRAFANQVIQYCVLYLSGGNDNGAEVIKTTEITEMIEKVQFACQLCDIFIEKYAEKS